MVGNAVLYLPEPLNRVDESGSEGTVRSGGVWICFLLIASYCCNSPESRDVSASQHAARNQHSRVTRHTVYDDMMAERRGSGRMVAENANMQREVSKLEGEAARPARRSQS